MAWFKIGNPTRFWNRPIPGTQGIDNIVGKALTPVRKGMKAGAIVGGVVLAVAGIGLIARSRRNRAAEESARDIANATPLTQQDVQPLTTEEMMGPAQGRAAGEWQARVAAQRGIGIAPGGPAQPNQTVAQNVQDLGNPQVR